MYIYQNISVTATGVWEQVIVTLPEWSSSDAQTRRKRLSVAYLLGLFFVIWREIEFYSSALGVFVSSCRSSASLQ